MKVHIPSGKQFIEYEIEQDRIVTSRLNEMKAQESGIELVRRAMDAPIGSERLCELAKGKKTCTLIISDHTRPVPSRDILPLMLKELREGNPELDITLLVATGCHRGTTEKELADKLGSEIAGREKIVVHDAFDPERNVRIGTLPSGAPLVIDRLAAECDLLVSEGFIEPHFFAGFSGGRKSVLPGVCDRVTVWGNHCGEFIASEKARTGLLDGNPINIDMEAAARLAKLQFIVNVVIDHEKHTAAAFAGDCIKAHRAGCEFLKQCAVVRPVYGDIVITSNGGAPLDQNLYQCVKGLTAAEGCIQGNGTIILCAGMADGIGGDGFYRAFWDCTSPAALYEEYRNTPMNETKQDNWQAQILCRVLMKHRVIFVTGRHMKQAIEDMKMEFAETLPEALAMANSDGKRITVIPDGVSVIIGEEKC